MRPMEPSDPTEMSNHKSITRRQLLASLSAAGVLLASGTIFTGEAEAAPVIPAANTTHTGWFNVKDFGAQGSSRYDQDDTVAFQAAINAASLFGGTVYVPAGRYIIQTGLLMRSKVHMLGAGAEASMLIAGQANMQMIICPTQVKQVSISGITFEGIGNSTSSIGSKVERGVHILEASFVHIQKCLFRNIANGIHLVRSEHVRVSDCVFLSIIAGDNAYEGYGVTAEGGANHSIQGNHFRSIARSCIQLVAGCSYCLVAGNVVEACREAAIMLSSKLSVCSNNMITGNIVSANGLIDKQTSCMHGIRLKDSCSYNHIVGNSITRSASAAIQLDAVDNAGDDRPYGNMVSGNKVDTSTLGLAVLNGEMNTFNGNEIRRVEIGISIDTIGEGSSSYAKQNIVTGNSLFQCSIAAVKLGSARCQSNTVFGNAGFDNGTGLYDNGADTITAGF